MPFLIPLQSLPFWGFLVAFNDAYNTKMHRCWYQSIDISCIVFLVKFEDGLSISVWKNKQLSTKKLGFKTDEFSKSRSSILFNLQTPPFKERTDLGKSILLLELIFLVNGMDNPTSNLAQTQKCFLSIN
jgi:hypothetical protein